MGYFQVWSLFFKLSVTWKIGSEFTMKSKNAPSNLIFTLIFLT